MRIMLQALSVLLSLTMVTGCDSSGGDGGGDGGGGGNGSGGGDGGGGASVNAPVRLWDRTLVQMDTAVPSFAVSSDGTTDIVYLGQGMSGELTIVWQTQMGTPEVIATETGSPIYIDQPIVVRDANQDLHVVWSNSGVIKYAVRKSNAWTTETVVLEGYRPDLAVASDGTPHVAFNDKQSAARAHHAVRQAGTWQITDVNGTNSIGLSNVSIVLTKENKPMLAALNQDNKGIWVAEEDGAGGFKLETIGADEFSQGGVDLAIGDAGVAVAFKGNKMTRVGIRAAGANDWTVENVASFDRSDEGVSITMGSKGIFVVADVDQEYPNGHAFLERKDTGWSGQMISRRLGCDWTAVEHDGSGEPVVALECGTSLYLMRVIGWYPADWAARCEQAAIEMCKPACSCGGSDECCWGLGGSSTCSSTYGCSFNAIPALCGDPTITPEALQACRDELPSLTCGAAGPLDLSGACAPLYLPFGQ